MYNQRHHHAVIPTRNLQGADLSGLPVGEKAVLELVALRLLCAVAQPYTFAETAVVVECAGAEFTAKGRTVKNYGWRALDATLLCLCNSHQSSPL